MIENLYFSFQGDEQTHSDTVSLHKKTQIKEIVLFNDDVNSFDFVIETLMNVCHHEAPQAEQCALITHYKGKCAVKKGNYNALLPVCTELLNRGLSAEII